MAADLKALGRYRIDRVLGKGAMGVVYEGFDPRLNRRVAIKTILKAHLDDESARDYSQRFVREAHAVAKLNHPNIVQVHDFGEEADIAYLVMEFIKGRELKSYFDRGERFELKDAVRIMCDLCEALDFAHRAGIIHRDVKPANLMLDAELRAKLTDFGVSRIQDPSATHVTQAGTLVGTPAYMSPEQITGKPVDARSDVFAAGIVLYQFLTGELPFSGGGAWTIAKKIMQDEPTLPSELDSTVSPLFDAVIAKALAKQPEERYQSARAMAAALKSALDGKPDAETEETVARMAATVARRAGTAKPVVADADVEFWRSIQDSRDAESFELYLEQFPSGIYAKLAARKLSSLRAGEGDIDRTVKAPPPPSKKGRAFVAISLIALAAAAGGWLWWTQFGSGPHAPGAPAAEVGSADAKAAEQAKLEEQSRNERLAAEKLAAEKANAEKAELERIAQQKAEEEKASAEKAAKEKEQREKLAAEKAAAARLAAAQAAAEKEIADKLAAEQRALAAREAAEKATADRLAAEKAEKERAARLAQDRDRAFWESVKDSKTSDEFKAYLEKFPEGLFAALARTRISTLEKATRSQATTYTPPPPPKPRYSTIGRVVEVFDSYGYVVFDSGMSLPNNSSVYIRTAGGSLVEFRVSKRAGSRISAVPVSGMRSVSAGNEVLRQVE